MRFSEYMIKNDVRTDLLVSWNTAQANVWAWGSAMSEESLVMPDNEQVRTSLDKTKSHETETLYSKRAHASLKYLPSH